jgi:hypothetical protein
MRSSARGVGLGGSSWTCSHPTGGEPGGEIRKFLDVSGGQRKTPPGPVVGGDMIVGSARNTRRITGGLVGINIKLSTSV